MAALAHAHAPREGPTSTAPNERPPRHENARFEREVARLQWKLENAERFPVLQLRTATVLERLEPPYNLAARRGAGMTFVDAHRVQLGEKPAYDALGVARAT